MKKIGFLIVVVSMLMLGSYAFADTGAREEEADGIQVDLLLEAEKTSHEGMLIGEVTILSSGEILVVSFDGNEASIQKVSAVGNVPVIDPLIVLGEWDTPRNILVNEMLNEFVVSRYGLAYRLDGDFQDIRWFHGMNYGREPLDAKGTAIAYMGERHLNFNHVVVEENEEDYGDIEWDGKEYWIDKRELSRDLGWESGTEFQKLAFGDQETDLFFLLKSPAGEWTIDQVQVDYTDRLPYLKFMREEGKDPIVLADLSTERIPTLFEYDQDEFQIVDSEGQEGRSIILRYDGNGALIDSAHVPGEAICFDMQGNRTVISTRGADDKDRVFLVYWEGKPDLSEPLLMSSSPRALIQEKTRSGETKAVFGDGKYGLLKKEDNETGRVEYQAPLRSNASKFKLQIPFVDLLSKLGDDRNLTILYGKEQIKIPMQVLDARELLKQLPCETGATIEIQLIRGEDGRVKVTAELFVVEEINAKTKLVHRVNLPL